MNAEELEKERQIILEGHVNDAIKNRVEYVKECQRKGELPCDLFTSLPHDLLPQNFNEDVAKRWRKALDIK